MAYAWHYAGRRPHGLRQSRAYGAAANRLMYYETFDSLGALESTTYYDYNDRGNPRYVMTERENPTGGEKRFTGTRLGYARNKMAVTYAIGEEWDDATTCIAPTGYEMLYAYEYRYDGARARYLKRSLDPAELLQGNFVSLGDTWTDYDGDTSYGDFSFDAQGQLTYGNWYQPGIAMGSDVTDPAATAYYHTDLIGTTRVMSDATGVGVSQFEYTAFGVPYPFEGGGDQRYGYAGAWGYQSDAAPGPAPSTGSMPFLHVGARYYDPTTGRFLQRDPIGISGGTNMYAYAWSNPLRYVDASGKKVFQIGVGGSVLIPIGPSAAAAAAVLDLSLFIDDNGGIGLGLTFGCGPGFGAYYGGGLTIGGYSGNVGDLAGPSSETGVDTPIGSASRVMGSGYGGLQGAVGPGHGGGLRTTGNYTCMVRPPPKPVLLLLVTLVQPVPPWGLSWGL